MRQKFFLTVEGPSDAIAFKAFLDSIDRHDIDVMAAGGRFAALALGSSLAKAQKGKVAVIVDADTVDQQSVEQQKKEIASNYFSEEDSSLFRVFFMLPNLESEIERAVRRRPNMPKFDQHFFDSGDGLFSRKFSEKDVIFFRKLFSELDLKNDNPFLSVVNFLSVDRKKRRLKI